MKIGVRSILVNIYQKYVNIREDIV